MNANNEAERTPPTAELGDDLGSINLAPAAVARLRARAAAGTAVQPENVIALCDALEAARSAALPETPSAARFVQQIKQKSQ